MSVRQINTANYDYAMMLEVINKSYKGKADITISEYDTTAAPSVKVGSVWEDNGAIFILETADMTPAEAGYNAVASSTTFYLYYDESAEVFIYSETAPTWSDALQGWYHNNDRAFFSMYKDSGDTLYEDKNLLLAQNNFEVPNDLTVNGKSLDTFMQKMKYLGWASYIKESFATPSTIPYGLAYDSSTDNLISCDTDSDLIYIHGVY